MSGCPILDVGHSKIEVEKNNGEMGSIVNFVSDFSSIITATTDTLVIYTLTLKQQG